MLMILISSVKVQKEIVPMIDNPIYNQTFLQWSNSRSNSSLSIVNFCNRGT
jgi:hypothetical protein